MNCRPAARQSGLPDPYVRRAAQQVILGSGRSDIAGRKFEGDLNGVRKDPLDGVNYAGPFGSSEFDHKIYGWSNECSRDQRFCV